MHTQLAKKLAKNKDRFPEIEVATGVTQQTMKNIVAEPSGKRQKSVIAMLTMFFENDKPVKK